MNQGHKEIIEQARKDAFDFRKEFFAYKRDTSIQLLFAQFGQFNSMCSIGIALMILGLGTSFIRIDIFSITSLLSLLCLIIYSNSYIRERIDQISKGIEEEERFVLKITEQTIDLTTKAELQDNEDIFFDFAKEEGSKKRKNQVLPIYAGEISNLLLFEGVFAGMFSFILRSQEQSNFVLFIFITLFSVFLSFWNWNNFITKKLSIFFEFIKKLKRKK